MSGSWGCRLGEVTMSIKKLAERVPLKSDSIITNAAAGSHRQRRQYRDINPASYDALDMDKWGPVEAPQTASGACLGLYAGRTLKEINDFVARWERQVPTVRAPDGSY